MSRVFPRSNVDQCEPCNGGRSLLRRRNGRRRLRRTVTCLGAFGAAGVSWASDSDGVMKAANGAAITPAATRFFTREPRRERLESILVIPLIKGRTQIDFNHAGHSSRPETRRV